LNSTSPWSHRLIRLAAVATVPLSLITAQGGLASPGGLAAPAGLAQTTTNNAQSGTAHVADQSHVRPAESSAPQTKPAATPAATAPATAPVARPAAATPVKPAAPAAAPAAGGWDAPHTNWLMVPSVGINLPVGTYNDCYARAAVSAGIASRDTCAPPATVFLLGHSPGVFAPLSSTHPGDLIRYWDGAGHATTYRETSVARQSIRNDGEMFNPGPPHLVMQTCANANGSMLWMVVAYPI
jgi:hypothetical protein